MTMVLAEGYRGLSLVWDLTLDRLLMPAAIMVALSGAAVIGVQLHEMMGPMAPASYQL
ncbi:hypothetical protein C8J27_10683 [Rhodobacter aestuarii]|uniref:Uncharacterized protein n=1 Tax=Rhodobacter aestuarii TaxID=453582 RepID=A0A1N7M3J0_9RHOB|nr:MULTISPECIES: hypothetical protein [Rhodobacter]PTV94815.1 hypothetical protein C8J27_10683 [Rhodobacter aestuarii]SIS80539.1 hypothetical protein SAMN05421580_10583 [Rhodobacter aestuarii]SOC14256.1 hypothetical protein SAMN05877809_107114 [Rhodobacter sp. JA431]